MLGINNINYNKVSVLIYSINNTNNEKMYLFGKLNYGNVWTTMESINNTLDLNDPVITGSRAVLEGTNNWGIGNNNLLGNNNLPPSSNLIPVKPAFITNEGLEPFPQALHRIGSLGRNIVYNPSFMPSARIISPTFSNSSNSFMPSTRIISPTFSDSSIAINTPIISNPLNNLPKNSNGPIGIVPKINIRLNNIARLGNNRLGNNRLGNNINYDSLNWVNTSLRSTNYTQHTINGQNIVSFIVLKMPYDINLPQRFLGSINVSNNQSQYSRLAWVSESEMQHLKNNCTQNTRNIPSLNNDTLSYEFCQLLKVINI